MDMHVVCLCVFLDNDECAAGTSGCAQQCTNTQGAYVCSCLAGYVLGADKHTCNFRCGNVLCPNGYSFVNGRCQCPAWRSGDCCEVCRHISIPNCVSGQQQCSGSPDGIMCTQCEPGYHSGGYNQGCIDDTCTFESADHCTWTDVPSGDDFDWTLTYGETPNSGTGPSTDHTQRNATGKYVYIETSGSRQTGDRAWLISSMHFPTYFTERCLQFWYNMNGPTIGFLSVYMTTHGERPGTLLWRMSGDQGQEWKGVSVELSSLEQYQIIIEGVAGSSCFGDIAIDDMAILPRACQLGEGLMIG